MYPKSTNFYLLSKPNADLVAKLQMPLKQFAVLFHVQCEITSRLPGVAVFLLVERRHGRVAFCHAESNSQSYSGIVFNTIT